MEFLSAIQDTALASWVRESTSLFAYTGMLFVHAVGLAICAGVSAAVALRILGVGSSIPLAPMERLFPVIWTGVWMNVLSGVPLVMSNATKDLINPTFYAKMLFILVAVIYVRRVRHQVFLAAPGGTVTEASDDGRRLARVMFAMWTGAIIAGRLCEYPQLLGLDYVMGH